MARTRGPRKGPFVVRPRARAFLIYGGVTQSVTHFNFQIIFSEVHRTRFGSTTDAPGRNRTCDLSLRRSPKGTSRGVRPHGYVAHGRPTGLHASRQAAGCDAGVTQPTPSTSDAGPEINAGVSCEASCKSIRPTTWCRSICYGRLHIKGRGTSRPSPVEPVRNTGKGGAYLWPPIAPRATTSTVCRT